MQRLELKPTHKPVQNYYSALRQFDDLGVTHETAVRSAFQGLLDHCARQHDWTLVPEWEIRRPRQHPLRVDGALLDNFRLTHGFWEAKDIRDDLPKEARKKFALGYPRDNILFQTPRRALLFQNDSLAFDADLTKPPALIDALNAFFGYTPPAYTEWERAVTEFQDRVPELARSLIEIIEKERKTNHRFIKAFADFAELARRSINPNLADAAVEEMLIQHLLTERLFRTIFNNPDFTRRNIIAAEIEKVIDALASHSFSRAEFLKKLDPFYLAMEQAAATIADFSQKQQFLNTVYEKFFQGFCVKVADTHGSVYTPPSIVRFMVKSMAEKIRKERRIQGRKPYCAGRPCAKRRHQMGLFIASSATATRTRRLPACCMTGFRDIRCWLGEHQLLPGDDLHEGIVCSSDRLLLPLRLNVNAV